MNQQESSRVLGFLAVARPDSQQMKSHIINSLNALLMSNDPASVRFSQVFIESMHSVAANVLNEATNPIPPQAYQHFTESQSGQGYGGQPTKPMPVSQSPEAAFEAIINRASLILG